MMNSKLQKVFKLESNEDLFIKATTPPSCGGDSTWKDLAHKGDILINKALDRIFTAQGIINSGSKTQRRAQFHNERTLVEIGV